MKNLDPEELLKELKTTKDYIDKLIDGINPVTGKSISTKEVIYEYKVSRQLDFLSDYLQDEIRKCEDGYMGNPHGKTEDTLEEYDITTKESQKYEFSETPITMADICNRLNSLRQSSKMRKLKGISAIEVLTTYGYIKRERRKVIPTAEGNALGIVIKEFLSNGNIMTKVVYGMEAQRFIVDHLREVMEINKTKRF
ncbi:MAG: hypothetical protein MJZ66_00415 [Bacteroidales bacterium]|nr:hypothetical protein [Bacteroidales bacterium]